MSCLLENVQKCFVIATVSNYMINTIMCSDNFNFTIVSLENIVNIIFIIIIIIIAIIVVVVVVVVIVVNLSVFLPHALFLSVLIYCFPSPLTIQPVLHNWYVKGHDRSSPICGNALIKDPFLVIGET